MRKPPKTQGKLSAVAQAQLGQSRVCKSCEKPKQIDQTNFKPLKKGLLGWSEVCNQCRTEGVTEDDVKEDIYSTELLVEDHATSELIEQMYGYPWVSEESRTAADALGARVKELAETDRRASLNLFIDIVSPLVAGWVEPGEIHEDIKDGLLDDEDALIIATRYSAKSTLCGIYLAWEIFLNPFVKILIISRGSTLAKRMLRTVRHVYIASCPMLKHLEPDDECLDNAEQFQSPQTLGQMTGGTTFTSMGITSNIVGLRSDITVCDDVEGPKDDTPGKVMALRETLNEIHMINPKGKKIMLGTYQSEFSVYALMASECDEMSNPVWSTHRALMFKEDDVGIHSRWPAQFSEKDGLGWKRKTTQRAWNLHIMLIADPSILNERPLKIGQFIVVDWDPDRLEFSRVVRGRGTDRRDITSWGAPDGDFWHGPADVDERLEPYVDTIMAVDPASGLAGRDAIGVAVLGITVGGQGVIRHIAAIRGPDKLDNIRRVAAIAHRFTPGVVVVEELADGLFGETLENEMLLLGVPAFVEKQTAGQQQKGRRIIETLSPPMAAGRLIMLECIASSDDGGEFVNQLVSISYDGRIAAGNDDIVDALAHAVFKAKGSLILDIADALAENRRSPVHNFNQRQTLGVDIDEMLAGEDEVLFKLEERHAALIEGIRSSMAAGDKQTVELLKMKWRETQRNIKMLKEGRMSRL